jgi:chemotaxis protein MotA
MDILSIGGIIGALLAILGGQALEGGHAGSLVQVTAAMIVGGGTLGAIMVAFPMHEFKRGMQLAKLAFTDKKDDTETLVQQIIELAGIARRDGVLALESKLSGISDAFLKRSVGYIVDGIDANVVREALETEAHHEFEAGNAGAKVWESAGGFAPTVGILGAVLGLIHVMENLSDPSKLGGGIATAFVATVYGVGAANLYLLPIANKIKRKVAFEKARKTVIIEGVLSIQEGLNPRVLEEKLRAYAGRHGEGEHK